MYVMMGLGPVHSDKDHLAPIVDDTLFEPEDPSSYLMDQCSRHDIPPAVEGDLTDRQGHDLNVGLKPGSIQCSPVGGSVASLASSRSEVVDPH
jgi:hypothetical protein